MRRTLSVLLFFAASFEAVAQGGYKAPPVNINPQPTPPTLPDGPKWHAAPAEAFRKQLEAYRSKLEERREQKGGQDNSEYRIGMKEYKESMSAYKARKQF